MNNLLFNTIELFKMLIHLLYVTPNKLTKLINFVRIYSLLVNKYHFHVLLYTSSLILWKFVTK